MAFHPTQGDKMIMSRLARLLAEVIDLEYKEEEDFYIIGHHAILEHLQEYHWSSWFYGRE